ncbi:MAG: 5-formyltetrahydrofolate cyclo-ligase [Nitrospiraceae bacterium]|nr:5-formyltetrahydrofolate cyclo-ligase [Nitrospiraceae bacterium]
MDKTEIRRLALTRRGLIGGDEKRKKAKDRAIGERLLALDAFSKAKTALFYASFRDEADTLGLIEWSLGAGKRVMLPRVEGRELALYHIGSMTELIKSRMSIPEPSGNGPAAGITEADIIIVPGVAFDLFGGRLGYGKGYYDRLLARPDKSTGKSVPIIALAYEAQIYEGRLPLAPHDIPMHCVITEKRTLRVAAGAPENEKRAVEKH